MTSAQNINDWNEMQEWMANNRPPYWSTVQLKDEDDEDPLMSILYEKDDSTDKRGEKFESIA